MSYHKSPPHEPRPRRALEEDDPDTEQSFADRKDWRKRLLKRTAATLAVSAVTATGIAVIHNATEPRRPDRIVTAGSGQPDVSPKIVEIALNSAKKKSANSHSDSEVAHESEDYCQVVDVTLPSQYEYAEAMLGSQTEFAISTEQFDKAQKQLLEAASREEVQDITDRVFDGIGIRTVYDAPLGEEFKPIKEPDDSTEAVEHYKAGMVSHMRGLALMPRDMLQEINKINFISDESMKKVDGKKIFFANGFYDHTNGEMGLTVPGALDKTIVHEAAHSIHEKACDSYSDAELEAQYTEAIEILNANPNREKLEDKFKSKTEENDEDWSEYVRQGAKFGFPSKYSRKDSVELMAELTEDIVCEKGFINNMDAQSARRLKEMVAERLQKGMPGVDVQAWWQYLGLYKNLRPYTISPETIQEQKISPFDLAYADFDGMEGADLRKAVELRMSNGVATYLYAAHNTAKAKDATMSFQLDATLTDDTKASIQSAAEAYMQAFARQSGREVVVTQGPGLGEKGTVYVTISLENTSDLQPTPVSE